MITEAIVTGLVDSDYSCEHIYVSHRSQETSAKLASRYATVEVLKDNQAIVDQSDIIVLAIRPKGATQDKA